MNMNDYTAGTLWGQTALDIWPFFCNDWQQEVLLGEICQPTLYKRIFEFKTTIINYKINKEPIQRFLNQYIIWMLCNTKVTKTVAMTNILS